MLNLAFTFVALPFYAFKESKQIRNRVFCQIFYTIIDFIIIFYMNSYCFIAYSRYKCICVRNFSHVKIDKEIIKRFLVISTLVSSISTANFLSSECKLFVESLIFDQHASATCNSILMGKKISYLNERFVVGTNETETINSFYAINEQTVEKLYRVIITLVVIVNLLVAICFYVLIIRYILQRNKKFEKKYKAAGMQKSKTTTVLNKRNSLIDFYLYVRHRTSLLIQNKYTSSINLKTSNPVDYKANPSVIVDLDSIELKPTDKMLTPNNIDDLPTPMRIRKSHSLPLTTNKSNRNNFDEISNDASITAISGCPPSTSINSMRLVNQINRKSKYGVKHNHKKSLKLFLSVSVSFLN